MLPATCDDVAVSEPRAHMKDPWDRVAAVYRVQEPLELRSIRALVGDVEPLPHERVVDLGSGPGTVCRMLSRAGQPLQLLAVERSGAMLEHGSYGCASVVRAEGQALPLADGSVDVLLAAWVLHVLPRSVRQQVLAEAARVLRPTGRFGFIVPARPSNPAQRLLRHLARSTTARPALGSLDLAVGLDEDLAEVGLHTVRRRRTGVGYLADVVVCLPDGCTAAPGHPVAP